MAREQLGICAEANLHGCYLFLNAQEGHEPILRNKLARLPSIFDRLAEHFSESMLTGVVAIGSNYWDLLYPDARPAGFTPFPDTQSVDIEMAAMPIDLFIQIRSDRQDVNFIACQQVLQLLQGDVEIQDMINAFRYLDGRNLTGFIDSQTNPKGRLKRQVALVDESVQPLFSGGSYLYVQQIVMDLSGWQHLNVAQQEAIMGVSKVSGQPLTPPLDASSASAATAATAEYLLQQNMPYAQLKQQGSVEVSYAANAEVLHKRLMTRLTDTELTDKYDQLLNYYQFAFSAAFFAPSVSFLELAAKH